MNTDLFLKTLPMMLYGMLGILLVIAVIYLITIMLTAIFSKKKNERKKE